jgi:hypothetical protein
LTRSKTPQTHNREQLRELITKSTPVVGWWEHTSTIRGPWHRWFTCELGTDEKGEHLAPVEDDVRFAAAAMNNLVHLLDELDEQDKKIYDLKMELLLMGRDPDALK